MTKSGFMTDGTPWQSLRVAVWLMAIACFSVASSLYGQLYDPLDTHPPRWFLGKSDCDARITEQTHLLEGGVGGGACEVINFSAGNGSEAQLVYPIEPVLPLDDLTATLNVMSAKSGASIGFRVRYPYVRDPVTKNAVAVTIYGASYQSPGEFASIGVGLIEKPLRLKHVALRSEYGLQVDLSDPYVDAVIVNAYSGSGATAIRVDNLRVNGMLPIGRELTAGVMERSRGIGANSTGSPLGVDTRGSSANATGSPIESSSQEMSTVPIAGAGVFPNGQVIRVLQYNGEPMRWVRSLGFDAIITRDPPTAELLREAIQTRVLIYASPPEQPDPALESLLDPVVGWYIGSSEVLDEAMVTSVAKTVRRLRLLPPRWQRPLLASPVESWRAYAPLLDGVVQDLPPRERSLNAQDEVMEVTRRLDQVGDRVSHAVGLLSMPPETLLRQNDAIAEAIGIPKPSSYHWHSMWVQAMRSLETLPRAIVYRSTRSLASGQPMDTQRAMAISYVNRMIAMISPWIASATKATPPVLSDGVYRCCRLTNEQADLLIMTSTASRGTEVLGGDGESLELQLTPSDATKTVWRLTHFSAERLSPLMTETGPKLEIVSPDVVEVLCLSSDPSVGGLLAKSAGQFLRQATMDRWQLANDAVERSQSQWIAATSMNRVSGQDTDRGGVSRFVDVAERTLSDAEPLFRSGDLGSAIRMARRADAWVLRSDWQLAEKLMPDWPNPTSCPPVMMGAEEVQVFWRPLMDDRGWGRNRLTSGSMDELQFFGEGRWTVGKRLTDRAESSVMRETLGTFAGPGALRASVTSLRDDPLPGGYEGTVLQIKSPTVRLKAGTAVRIDAWIKTIGFGGPHQGALVYETISGPEMGLLLKNYPTWTPVRLYRQAEKDGEVRVLFELLGAGELMVDEVELRIWEPVVQTELPFEPILK